MNLINLKYKKEYSLQDMIRSLRFRIKIARKIKYELIVIKKETELQ